MVKNVVAQFQRNSTSSGRADLAQYLSCSADICTVDQHQECRATQNWSNTQSHKLVLNAYQRVGEGFYASIHANYPWVVKVSIKTDFHNNDNCSTTDTEMVEKEAAQPVPVSQV